VKKYDRWRRASAPAGHFLSGHERLAGTAISDPHGFLWLLLTCFLACNGAGTQPQITPAVHLNNAAVPMGTPVEVTYSFTTTPQFQGLKKDYVIFVRFRDPRGVIRFIDDHSPPVLSNQWQPAQTYAYTRTVIVPEKIPQGNYSIEMGMYQTSGRGERILMNAPKVSIRSYLMGHLQILPYSEAGEYVRGWYDLESDPQEDWYHWRWMGKEAVLRVSSPQADSILYLKGETDLSRFQQPPDITVRVGAQTVDVFELNTGEFMKKYFVSQQQLGPGATVDLTLQTGETFVPSGAGNSKDTRELGLKIILFYLAKAR
jgi:hypothetical protein